MSNKSHRRPRRPARILAQPAVPSTDLGPKTAGQHRWVAVAAYTVTDAEARISATPGAGSILLDRSKLIECGVSCIDCEKPWFAAVDKPCEAESEWKDKSR